MRFKTLLLGSAAVIASAAAAQAADLSVAEPVDYVRVCDAFGEGYWYIPGTDTCIALSGKVEFGMEFGDDKDFDEHEWNFYTSVDVNVEARSMTDWGPLVAYITLTSDYDGDEFGDSDEDQYVFLDEAFITLGPLLLGYTGSVFDVQGGGYTDSDFDLSDTDINQVQLSWAFNGFGVAIGIEDPTERFGSSADSLPVLAAALTTEFSGWEAGLSFLYGANDDEDLVAVEGVLSTQVGMWEFQLGAIWADGVTADALEGPLDDGGYAVSVSSKQNWQSNFYTAETFVWVDDDANDTDWLAAFTVGYSPVDSLWFVADASTEDEGDNWNFLIYAEKTFGPNG